MSDEELDDEYAQEESPEDKLSHRDYFAALAMQGILASDSSLRRPDQLAEKAYEIAEAMMRQRALK